MRLRRHNMAYIFPPISIFLYMESPLYMESTQLDLHIRITLSIPNLLVQLHHGSLDLNDTV